MGSRRSRRSKKSWGKGGPDGAGVTWGVGGADGAGGT